MAERCKTRPTVREALRMLGVPSSKAPLIEAPERAAGGRCCYCGNVSETVIPVKIHPRVWDPARCQACEGAGILHDFCGDHLAEYQRARIAFERPRAKRSRELAAGRKSKKKTTKKNPSSPEGSRTTPREPSGQPETVVVSPAIPGRGERLRGGRGARSYTLRAPFPWFGGKSRAASLIWEGLGDVRNYVEPFAGSLAVMLARPTEARIETVNDLDCYLANFWRAVALDPEAVAAAADWPVNEADLHARHRWLVDRAEFRERMRSDPDFYDAKIAGWWAWGLSCWIGGGWCANTVHRFEKAAATCNRCAAAILKELGVRRPR
jgi:hypothetical protein